MASLHWYVFCLLISWLVVPSSTSMRTHALDHDDAVSGSMSVLRTRTITPLLPTMTTIASDIANAKQVLKTINSDGSWSDVNYSDVSHNGRDHWSAVTHLQRLTTMVTPLVACDVKGNTLCNATTLATAVEMSLQFWLMRNPCSENWFFNQIDAPGLLANILLLLQYGDKLSSQTLTDADVDIRRGADWWRGWSGFNLVSLAQLQIMRGLLLNNTMLVTQGFSAVWGQVEVMAWPATPPSATGAARCNSSSLAKTSCIPNSCQIGGGTYLGDGIQIDGSYHQHGAQLLSGAYGVGFVSAILEFLPRGVGTIWACPPERLDSLALVVLQGQRRMSLPTSSSTTTTSSSSSLSPTASHSSPVWDWLVCGRGCSISGGVATVGLSSAGLRYVAGLFAPKSDNAIGFTNYADAIDGTAVDDLEGSYSFFRSDYLLHRRKGWSASWKGRSNRTVAARCVNGDSKMSAETGEGSTFVYRTNEGGGAHAAIWSVINWQQYPGTTVQQGDLQDCNWLFTYTGYPTFVGSVSDTHMGAAAQVLHNHRLTARRSWLFLDNAVASFVSDAITTPPTNSSSSSKTTTTPPTNSSVTTTTTTTAPDPVFTTLANQRLNGNVTVVCVNGSSMILAQGNHSFEATTVFSIAHNHTTYAFTNVGEHAIIHIENGRRVGDYFRISTVHKPTAGNVFRISYEHTVVTATNTSSSLADVGFVVFPNVESVNTIGITMQTTTTTHTIVDTHSGITAITFWDKGSVALTLPQRRSDSLAPHTKSDGLATPTQIAVSAPCIVLVNPTISSSSSSSSSSSPSSSSPSSSSLSSSSSSSSPSSPSLASSSLSSSSSSSSSSSLLRDSLTMSDVYKTNNEIMSVSVSNPNIANGLNLSMVMTGISIVSVKGEGCSLHANNNNSEINNNNSTTVVYDLPGGDLIGTTITCVIQWTTPTKY